MSRRWDGDERGRGIADAKRLVSGADELVAAFRERDWVAEDPELHLKPHIEAWCEADGRFALTGARGDEEGAYVLDLSWRAAPAGPGEVRAAVYALIGRFAESATYVRQRKIPTAGSTQKLRFEVGTGELEGGAFAPHGHTVLIDVTQA